MFLSHISVSLSLSLSNFSLSLPLSLKSINISLGEDYGKKTFLNYHMLQNKACIVLTSNLRKYQIVLLGKI